VEVMSFNLSTLNATYRNLSEVEHSENAWRVVRVTDPIGHAAYQAFTKCWSEKFLGESHFEELRSALGVAYRALRTLVGPDENIRSHCAELLSDLRTGIHRAENFLSENERNLLAEALQRFEEFFNADAFALSAAVMDLVNVGVHKKSLVIENAKIAPLASELMPNVDTYQSIPRLLANTNSSDRNHAVLLCGLDTHRINIDHMRRLLLGGTFVKVTFVIPNWWPVGV
jgi:hypothetical protein